MAIRDMFSMTRKRLEDLANEKTTTLSPEAQAIKDRYLARHQNTGSVTVQAAEPVFTPAVPTAPSISGDTVTRVPAKNRQAAVGSTTVTATTLSPEAQAIKDRYLARRQEKQEKQTEAQRTELLGGLAEQTGSSYNDLMQRVTEFGERNTDPRKANADEISALRKEISDLSTHYRDYGNAYDTTYEGSPSGQFLSGLNAADAALAQMQNRKRTWDEMSPFEQLAATAREKIGDRAEAYEEYLATDYDIDAAKRQVGDLQNQLDEIKRSTYGNAPAPAGDRYDAEAAYAENRQQMDDLETRIGQLETEIGKAEGIRAERAEAEEYDRVMAPYRALTTSQQFAENNGYHSTRHGEPVRNDFSGVYTDTGFDDILHDYINGNPEATARQIAITTNDNTAFLGIAPTQLAFLTDEERDIYNYLYNVQGKEPAQEFLKSIGSYLNKRNREAEAVEWSRIATENPISANIVSVPLNAIGGVLGSAAAAADMMQGKEIDQNAGEFRLTRIPAEIRGAVAEKISDTWAGDVGSFLYQTGMSMADFLFTTAVTGGFSGGGKAAEALNLGIMGSTAAANSVIEAKDAGMDDRTAFIIGAIAGAAEIITEKISLESLLDKTNLDKSVRGYILKNILSEGSEEAASDLINIAADIIIAGDQGTFAADVREHGAAQAVLNRLKEIGLDALGGAISGGVMAGAGAVINSGIGDITPVSTYRTGRGIVENGGVQQLLTDAEGMNPNTGAYRLGAELNRRFAAKGIDLGTDAEKIGIRATYDVGRLANRVERQTGRDVESLAILRQAAEDMTAEGTVSEESANAVLADQGARRELGLTGRKADDPAKTVTDALTRYRTAQEREAANTANYTTKDRTTPQTAVNQERSVAIQARDTNAVNDFADSLGKAGKTVVSGLYDAGTDAERYIPTANDYYRAGVRGDGIETVETEYGSVLTEEVKQQIYDAGVTDAERQNDQTTPEAAETTEREDMGNGREIRDSDSGERDDGANPGEPVRGVEESAGRDQSESDQRGWEYADPEISEGAFGRKVSTASFGIAGGSAVADVYRYDGTTAALTRAKNEARKRGYSVVAFAGGDMTINGEGGYRGVIEMKNRRIFVRADDATYTAEQLVMHELAHDRIRRGEISVSDVRNRLEKHYGKHYAEEVAAAYEQAYRGSDMTAEQIWAELICDAVAGMNSFDFLAQLRRAGETAANRIRTVAATNTVEGADVMTEGVHETADAENAAQKRAKPKDLEPSRRAQSVEELRKENEELRAELNQLNGVRAEARRNAALADYFEGQTKRTKTPTVRAADAEKLAKTILEEYQSKADKNAVAEAIRDIGNYVVAGEPKTGVIDWNTLRDMATKTAHTVVASASALREGFDKEKIREIRKYLKGIQIRYRDDADIGDYGIWKKHNASRLKISETAGRSIDSFWADLQEHYGKQFFPDEIQLESEMLMHISDMLDDFRDLYENPFDVDMAEAVEYCANEIIDRAISEELRQTEPTFADKKAAEIAKTRADSLLAGEMAQARADAKRYGKLEREYAEYRENAKEKISAIRENRDRKIASLKKQYAERQKTRIENAAKGAARKKLVSHIKRLSGDLLANSDKRHIPERFRTSVAAILDAIDVGSALYDADGKPIPNTHAATKKTEAFLDLQEQYRDINVNGNMVIDPDLLSTDDADGLIDEVRKISGIPVDAMTLEQLETVQRLVTAIEASIKTYNKVLSQAKAENINEWASTVIKESETAKDVTRFKKIEDIEDMLSVSMLTPEAYFHRWGLGGEWMFRALRDAQDKFTTTMEKVVSDMGKLLGDYNVKTAEKTMHHVKLGGKDVEMSTAQLMDLAALYTRQDANGKRTVYEHLTAGGIFLDGKPSGARYKVRTGPIRNVTVEEIENAVALLSPEDVRVVQGMQEYASTVLAEVGNEASMAVYGYKKFRESNYWPIRVNGQETRQTVEKDTQVTSVAGYGFTKSLKPKATNSVRVGSAFDTFITHATQMATYASYLAVTEDATRLRNWTVVADDGSRQGNFREAVDKILGSSGSRYFAKLLQDISIGVRGNNTEGPLSSGWFSRFKSATVGANLRVVMQQPTAILRALDMIDMKYFAAGLNPLKAIEGWEKAVKYAPIARWKSWGYFDVGMGRNMKDVVFPTAEKTIDRVRDVGGALAGFADSFAWGQIWNAVEAETRHTQKGLTGDAFNQAVARRFTEIIDHTQVVDGILQRSQIMRDADGITKMSTSFMSEPIKQYNMFLSAAWDLRHGNMGKAVSRKRFARTAVALTVSGTVNAFVQSIVDAMRHSDREKDYWERIMTEFYGVSGDETAWYDYVKNIMTSNMGDWLNIGNYIPFVKEVVSLAEGYSVERMDMEGIAKAISAVISMVKAIKGTGSKAAWVYATEMTATVADLFGIPASSLKRDVLSVIEAVVNDFGNDLLKYRFDKATKNTSSDDNRGGFIDILYHAYRFDRGAYEIMYSDMVRSGIATEEAIAKGIENRLKRDEGVDSVNDLDRRYLSPSQEKAWDRMMSRLSSSELYRSADDDVQNAVEADAFALAHGDKAITDEAYDAYRNGVSEGNFLLWRLALRMADEENNGNGYYDKDEKQAAVEMLDIRQKAADYLLGR